MFRTEPFVSEKVWGYENWIVSTHAHGQSLVEDKKLSAIVGNDYPLLIKVIQANDTLSVQVHPDDNYAKLVENTFGKTECWYILDAEPNACLISGLNQECSKSQMTTAIQQGNFGELLKKVPVKKGDFIFIPAGTVHAIQGGLRILEIQEPSDITYRLFDWGRPRELHIEKGIEVTKQGYSAPIENFSHFECKYFNLSKITLSKDNSFEPKILQPKTPAAKSRTISLFCLKGEAELISTDGSVLHCKKEDTIMLSMEEKITVQNTKTDTIEFMAIM